MREEGFTYADREIFKTGKEEIIMDTVLSDEFMDKVQDNFAPIESLMAYYRCAIMEVETKFNVLNEQFSCNMTEIRSSLLRRE